MITKFLSIITVSYNSEATIKQTLDSVENQTDQDFEYIIIDGGSSDSTLDIIKNYNCVDHLISEPDNGIYDGMNKGIEKASGKFIGFLNSDDLFASKDVTKDLLKAIKLYDTEIIYGDIKYFNDDINKNTRFWHSEHTSKIHFQKDGILLILLFMLPNIFS